MIKTVPALHVSTSWPMNLLTPARTSLSCKTYFFLLINQLLSLLLSTTTIYSNTSLNLDGVYLEMDLELEAEMDSNTTEVWFWSAYTYYVLFNPLKVYQYMSLFFGDPLFRSSEINLTLPEECRGADNKMMTMLTQRVCIINIL